MGALRFLFAPELTRSLMDAARSSAELFGRMGVVRLQAPFDGSVDLGHRDWREDPATDLSRAKRRVPEEAAFLPIWSFRRCLPVSG